MWKCGSVYRPRMQDFTFKFSCGIFLVSSWHVVLIFSHICQLQYGFECFGYHTVAVVWNLDFESPIIQFNTTTKTLFSSLVISSGRTAYGSREWVIKKSHSSITTCTSSCRVLMMQPQYPGKYSISCLKKSHTKKVDSIKHLQRITSDHWPQIWLQLPDCMCPRYILVPQLLSAREPPQLISTPSSVGETILFFTSGSLIFLK